MSRERLIRSQRNSQLRRDYGITLDKYNRMLQEQRGVCALCGAAPPVGRKKVLAVDHDHDTGRVRGLLCAACNMVLVRGRDAAFFRLFLPRVIEYLERAA